MRCSRSLVRINDTAQSRLDRLFALAAECRYPIGGSVDRTAAFCAIELQSAWSEFCRAFVVSCALRAKRSDGTRVSTSQVQIGSPQDALLFSLQVTRPKVAARAAKGSTIRPLDEPLWRDPNTVLKIMQGLQASNEQDVQVALSHPTSVFTGLVKVRNFFAHRGRGTVLELPRVAQQLGIPAARSAVEIACSPLPGRAVTTIQSWIYDCKIIVARMCR